MIGWIFSNNNPLWRTPPRGLISTMTRELYAEPRYSYTALHHTEDITLWSQQVSHKVQLFKKKKI